ncbi:unnamed protein product [Caenorhabditis auriculariae]|uniref:Uncharacterized protein n=1 Tax=Caenorhabditis auriculariae TaxID=2777116 RepID=A0A8S1GNN5_9PELO|nr:unnamed protein product [Caenorhabditis auriculariae]
MALVFSDDEDAERFSEIIRSAKCVEENEKSKENKGTFEDEARLLLQDVNKPRLDVIVRPLMRSRDCADPYEEGFFEHNVEFRKESLGTGFGYFGDKGEIDAKGKEKGTKSKREELIIEREKRLKNIAKTTPSTKQKFPEILVDTPISEPPSKKKNISDTPKSTRKKKKKIESSSDEDSDVETSSMKRKISKTFDDTPAHSSKKSNISDTPKSNGRKKKKIEESSSDDSEVTTPPPRRRLPRTFVKTPISAPSSKKENISDAPKSNGKKKKKIEDESDDDDSDETTSSSRRRRTRTSVETPTFVAPPPKIKNISDTSKSKMRKKRKVESSSDEDTDQSTPITKRKDVDTPLTGKKKKSDTPKSTRRKKRKLGDSTEDDSDVENDFVAEFSAGETPKSDRKLRKRRNLRQLQESFDEELELSLAKFQK